MVFAVVYLHGAPIDMGFERVQRIRKFGKFEGHFQ